MTGVEGEVEAREAVTGSDLLALAVEYNGIELGRPVDLIVDLGQARVLALELVCGDEAHRLLPFPAARVGPEAIVVASPLAVIEAAAGVFYRERAETLRSLHGASVARGGKQLGRLADVVVLADGRIVELVVDAAGGDRRVPLDDGVLVAGARAVSR